MSNTTNSVSKIKILSWNCQSIVPKLNETFDYLMKHKIKIALFSETWLKANKKINFPGYRFYRLDRQSDEHGGVAIAIDSSLKHKHVSLPPTTVIESVAISVDTPSGEITFVSAYFPGTNVTSRVLEHYRQDIRTLTSIKSPYYICGDLNSKHRMWNNVTGNAAGYVLYQEMSRNPFNILHSATPTCFPTQRGRRPSNIDVVLTNDLLSADPVETSNDLISDHRAIEFAINVNVTPFNHQKKSFRFDLANWSLFKSYVNDKINLPTPLNSCSDIDAAVAKFTKIATDAMKASIPQRNCKPKFFRINAEIRELIRLKNRNKRKWQRTGIAHYSTCCNALTRQIQKKIELLRNKNWSSRLESFDFASKRFWQTTKLLKNRNDYLPPLKGNDGTVAYTNHQKSETLAGAFHKSHTLTLSYNNKRTENAVNCSMRQIDDARIDASELAKLLTKPKEIHNILRSLKVRKSPGDDYVTNKILKQIPKRAVVFLTTVFNACMKFSYFPANWKIARVVAIPKPNKSLTSAASYRPISLLSSVSKLLERVLLKRIRDHVEVNDIIPDEQFGFRPKHSTIHQLYRITHHIEREFNNKKSTGMVTLDIEKAFDSIWHDGLLHKLLVLKFNIVLVKILKSFLENRFYYVHMYDSKSSLYNIPAGLPQGSALSPVLYNVYTSDICTLNRCNLAQFADDTSIYRSHRNPKVIMRALESSVMRLKNYFEKWKIQVNEAKTQAIFFTKRRAPRFIPTRKLNLNSTHVDWSNCIKYLGVLLDQKLTFKKQVDYAKERAQKYVRILYSLINRRSKLDVRNKNLIFKSIFRPIMFYGAPVWGNCAVTHRKSLQVTQNKILKIINNKPFYYSTRRLHAETKNQLVNETIDKLKTNFEGKCRSSENPLIIGLTSV